MRLMTYCHVFQVGHGVNSGLGDWGWESVLRLYYAVLWVQCCQIELASQTRLGEICKDSYRTLLEVIAQAKDFGFGREAGIPIFLSERMSRSGESLSPKREREECSVVGLTRSSGEKFDFWAKRELA
ncbi:hypothetical protein DEO72_LG8g1011 [Vigna unguiculata]|uniref:Uncharacterized protein n=1 Tax=Vigna unguiculata TaxID=3917 RepID=A0A4D6MQG5_VIGUN|nr:hypothetical protein DEO72_LG8g1011 [Vigna unguiculata]